MPVSVKVVNCLIRGPQSLGILGLLKTDKRPRGTVEFQDCTCENIDYPGVFCVWNNASPLRFRFINCKWRNVALRIRETPIDLELLQEAAAAQKGVIEFVNCYVYDDKDRPFAKAKGAGAGTENPAVTGAFTVINPHGGRLDAASTKALNGVRVRYTANHD
jgi:hypothetical protein